MRNRSGCRFCTAVHTTVASLWPGLCPGDLRDIQYSRRRGPDWPDAAGRLAGESMLSSDGTVRAAAETSGCRRPEVRTDDWGESGKHYGLAAIARRGKRRAAGGI